MKLNLFLREDSSSLLPTISSVAQVSNENKVLKRKSQMLMPLIPELPDNLVSFPLDAETDLSADVDVVDFGSCNNDDALLLESQAKITG